MNEKIIFKKVGSKDRKLLTIITDWYMEEWQIPREHSLNRLAGKDNNDIIFQLVLLKDRIPIATGGLYNKVGLLKVHPEFNLYKPWVALLYTSVENRNQGYGGILLKKIEAQAKEMKYNTVYLHTFTAEKLYLKNNWQPIAQASYKQHITTIMKKDI